MLRKVMPFLAILLATPAMAQNLPLVMQPETAVVGPGGVDMVTGIHRNETTELSIGSEANGGITFTRMNGRAKNAELTICSSLALRATSCAMTAPISCTDFESSWTASQIRRCESGKDGSLSMPEMNAARSGSATKLRNLVARATSDCSVAVS